MLELVVSHAELEISQLSQGCRLFVTPNQTAALLLPFEGVADSRLLNEELQALGWEALDDSVAAMEFWDGLWDGVHYEGMVAHCVAYQGLSALTVRLTANSNKEVMVA